MTVVYLGEEPEGRSGTNRLGVRSYQRVFNLETTLQSEGAFAVGSNASLPDIGSVHPEDSTAFCTDLDVRCVKGWKVWQVTATYSSEFTLSTTPTSDPAIIRWDSEQFQKPAVFDKNGDAILNSAGDFFDPPLMVDDSRRIVTVTKNLSSVPSWILTYQDAVNNASFTVDGVTVGTGLAKMQRVSVSEVQSRNGTNFRTVEFTIHLQKSGWLLEPLDAGFREKGARPGTRVNILNDDKTLPSTPVPLDGTGFVLEDPTPATAVYGSFAYYETKDFSVLPLT